MKLLFVATSLALACAAHAQATTCVQGVVGQATSASITFTAPTTNTDGSALTLPLTYNLYQSSVSGAEVKVATALKGSPIAVTTGLTPRTTYYWKLTTVDGGGNESALSNEVCKVFPASVPGTVTITISQLAQSIGEFLPG
jgi:opacity protein-like surface antigen